MVKEIAVVSVIAPNSIGVLKRPAEWLKVHEINIVDQCGFETFDGLLFNGQFLIEALPKVMSDLELTIQAELPGLNAQLLRIRALPVVFDGPTTKFEIDASAADEIGLFFALAFLLQQHSINIKSIRSTTRPAAHTGTPEFAVIAQLQIAGERRLDALARLFDQLWMVKALVSVRMGWDGDPDGTRPQLPTPMAA